MKAKSAVAAAGLLIWSPCAGGELPNYDIHTHCNASTAMFGINQKLFIGSCVAAEEKSKGQIAARLSDFDEDVLKQCDALAATTAGGSYLIFSGCLANNISARFLDGQIDIVRRGAKAGGQPISVEKLDNGK